MRSTLLSLLALAATLVPLVAACNSQEPAVDFVPRELRGRWVLSELEGADLTDLDLNGVRRPEILIDAEGSLSGFGGVNRIGSSLDLDVLGLQTWVLSPVASTMMAGEPEAMKLESRFNQALQDARRYRLDGKVLLILEDEAGERLMVLSRQG